MKMSDHREFVQYLMQCTDRQVLGVLYKENDAGRGEYAALAHAEAYRRGLVEEPTP